MRQIVCVIETIVAIVIFTIFMNAFAWIQEYERNI